MRKTRKILIFISVLIAGLVSALGIYSALDADFIYNFGSKVNDAKLFSGIRMALLFGSLLFLVIVISILFTFRKRKKAVEAIRITNAGGTLSISSQTIERLAELVAKSTEGIFDIRTSVLSNENKPTVEVRAKVPPTVSIPEVSVRLQESIRNKIMDTTGTDIENIRILIDGIVDSEK
jgi:uncharacterized alkaline shock family protein YloU